MKTFSRFAMVMALCISTTASASGTRNSPSSAHGLQGTWDVVHVRVDLRDQPHWLYKPDDPRLMRRELQVGQERLTFDVGMDPCPAPRLVAQQTTWKVLVGKAFRRPLRYRTPPVPGPKDFELHLSPQAPMTVYRVSCADGSRPPREPWSDGWLLPIGKDRLLMNYGGMALLELRRRSTNAKPEPSFDCAAATKESLQAICRSYPLAALDRTVDQTLKETLKHRNDEAERLQREHTEWVLTRDACGADQACLAERMQGQIEALVQQW